MKSITLVCALIFYLISSESFSQCPSYGSATDEAHQDLNRGKNKSMITPDQSPVFLPLRNLITSKKRNDINLYRNGAYIYTEGYLISAEEQGPESCNCNKASIAKKNGDVHIYLALVPNAPKKNSIVVEITPAYKKKHTNYSEPLQPGTRVRVEGFLLYDFEHKGNAVNTCINCGNVWRKTCWEIHPVTSISIIE